MKTEHNTIYLREYQPHPYRISHTELEIELGIKCTRIHARHRLSRQQDDAVALVLDSEDTVIESVAIDGSPLPLAGYEQRDDQLIIQQLPANCELEIVNIINPSANTSLSGLYHSGTMLCTQCEAEGFRRITPSIDRPDNLATFRVTLRGDSKQFPVLLCNGNLVSDETVDNIHQTTWEDPFPKPTYLFAIVAGELSRLHDTFVTRSGKAVALDFYASDRDIEKCIYAMGALKRSMHWDEQVYGREYDLELFNVVAVGDFNMGAMENKSLNIFNTKYVLADPDIASDTDFHHVESVIAHEYFHNWSGNRVTCRDWFQLSLKEGFTVFRDQSFSADMGSAGVQRINDVNVLRNQQFPEDAGPMAHPVRPASYQEINNFYTATVYNKGAEVVRMLHTLAGANWFRRGTDLYFSRHDGQAVTTDDFVTAIADSRESEPAVDFEQFKHWYNQAGTPEVTVRSSYDRSSQRYTLDCSQHCTPGAGAPSTLPFLIPLRTALFTPAGKKLPLSDGQHEITLVLDQQQQQFVFEDIPVEPVASLLRGFSSPVNLRQEMNIESRSVLYLHDDDPFNRWENGQQLFQQEILQNVSRIRSEKPCKYNQSVIDIVAHVLQDPSHDNALVARLLTLPGEAWLAELSKPVDPVAIASARRQLQQKLAAEHYALLISRYQELESQNDGSQGAIQSGVRSLRDCCLGLLCSLDTRETRAIARTQFDTSRNMTDATSALMAIADSQDPDRQQVLEQFYQHWQHEALVVDRWLRIQATARHIDTFNQVRQLCLHPAFDQSNPNKIYALILAFTRGNPEQFHRSDGQGYAFLGEWVVRLNQVNPQVAARLVSGFNGWKNMIPGLGEQMNAQLQQIHARQDLSSDVAEIVSRALQQTSSTQGGTGP